MSIPFIFVLIKSISFILHLIKFTLINLELKKLELFNGVNGLLLNLLSAKLLKLTRNFQKVNSLSSILPKQFLKVYNF